MRAWLLALALTGAPAALAGPTVPRGDLAVVPEAWHATWAPYEEALDAARGETQAARGELMQAKASAKRAEQELEAAQAELKEAKKAQKTAAKSKSVEGGRAAADLRARAENHLRQSQRKADEAAAQQALSEAILALAEARQEHADARLQQVRAQAVSDAGGWVDVVKFDEAVVDAEKGVKKAEGELEHARARVVLAGQ